MTTPAPTPQRDPNPTTHPEPKHPIPPPRPTKSKPRVVSRDRDERLARMRPEDIASAKRVAAAAPLPGPELVAKLIVLLDTSRRVPRKAA